MQTLHIITDLIASIGNVVFMAFALISFFCLGQMREQLDKIHSMQQTLLMRTLAEHVRGNFAELERLQNILQELIDKENYEAAQTLKTQIDELKKVAMKELKQFQELFGEGTVKIIKIQ